MDREFKYIDMDLVNKRIEESEDQPIYEPPENVLYETVLDLLQVAYNEGMTEAEIDQVIRRVIDYRATDVRSRFRLHTQDE